jgi:hypothetical protein
MRDLTIGLRAPELTRAVIEMRIKARAVIAIEAARRDFPYFM